MFNKCVDIIINEPCNKYAQKIYQGQRWRYPTMTDVKFVNESFIVAAHRYACKVYLIRMHEYGFETKDVLTLTYNGAPHQTESLIVVDNIMYVISYTNIMTVIEITPTMKLQQRASIKLSPSNIPFHGITHHDNDVYVTPSNRFIGKEYIIKYNPKDNAITHIASLGDNVRVKSLTFLTNTVVVVITYKQTTSMTQKGHTFDSAIRLYTHKFALLDSVEIPSTHIDCIISKNNIFYATAANLIGGYIMKGSVIDQKISFVHGYQVDDFPHGIDILDNTIAYTSYTTSGVHILDVATLEAKPPELVWKT